MELQQPLPRSPSRRRSPHLVLAPPPRPQQPPPVSRRASSGRRRDVAHIAAPPPPPPKPKALALLVVHEPALLTGAFNPLALAEPSPQSSPTAREPISDAGSEDWEVVSPKAIDSHHDRWTDVPA